MEDKRGHVGPSGTHSPHGHSPQHQVPAGSPWPAVGRARAACGEAAGGKGGKGFGASLGLGCPGDGAMWEWDAPRTWGAPGFGNGLWGCPWKLEGLRGVTEVPLGIEGIWGWWGLQGGDGGAPRGWDVPRDWGCFGPSPFAAAALSQHGHHALYGAQHRAVDQHRPRRPSSCTVGAQRGGAVGRHCSSQHSPSLNPPVLHMAPILPLPPHPPLDRLSPNPYRSSGPNPMPSGPYSCPLGPDPMSTPHPIPKPAPSPSPNTSPALPTSSIFNPAPLPLPGVLQPKPLGHLEIQLDGATLVMPPQCILDPDIDLQKGKAAGVALPTLTYGTQWPWKTIRGP